LAGVEPQREPAWVPPRVGAAPLTRDGGEPGHRAGPGPGLEHRRPRVPADVAGHLKVAERAGPLSVRLPFRYPLAVEVGHLLDLVEIIEQDRAVGPHRQRMLLA